MESCHRLLDGHLESELLEAANAAGCHGMATDFVEMVGAQIDEVRAVLEHPVDSDKDGVSDCHRRALAAAASGQPLIARGEEVGLGPPSANRSQRNLN